MSKEQAVTLFFTVWGYLLVGLIFGAITKKMGETKGYTNQFWWGFFLGIIGLIVVAVRPDMNQKIIVQQVPQQTNQQSADDVETQLQKYQEMEEKGLISQEDFEAKKKQLLGL